LTDAALVMTTVGINEEAGAATNRGDPQGRLRLLEKNVAICRMSSVSAWNNALKRYATPSNEPPLTVVSKQRTQDRCCGLLPDGLSAPIARAAPLMLCPARIEAFAFPER
jgi:hypothetical protein